jgi:hypothetical protein
MTEKKPGRWKAGESGNPRGRRPGTGEVGKLRAAIGKHVPTIIKKLVAAAQGGDVGAARLLLERVLPPVKAVEQTQPMTLPDGDLTAKGHAVLAAAAKGEIAPAQAAALIGALGTLARVAEIDDLARRIEALEKQGGAS